MPELTGPVSVVNGQTFIVQHDDGLQLMIRSLLVVNVPGPRGRVITTVGYNGPTGTFAFDLVYDECCGGSAVLATSLPLQAAAAVPETRKLRHVARWFRTVGIHGASQQTAIRLIKFAARTEAPLRRGFC
jgi:hypothetical protein